MPLSSGRWAVIVVLVVAGVYAAIWHTSPLPGNHEALAGQPLGDLHIAHAVIGIILLAAAGYVWYAARKATPTTVTK